LLDGSFLFYEHAAVHAGTMEDTKTAEEILDSVARPVAGVLTEDARGAPLRVPIREPYEKPSGKIPDGSCDDLRSIL